MLSKNLKYHYEMLYMLFQISRIDEDVIKEYQEEPIQVLVEHSVMKRMKLPGTLVKPNGTIVTS